MRICVLFVFSWLLFVSVGHAQNNFKIDMPRVIVQGIPVNLSIIPLDSLTLKCYDGKVVQVGLDGEIYSPILSQGKATIEYTFIHKSDIVVNQQSTVTVNPIPLWMSVLPPLVAILMALIFKEVFSALFTGLLVGTFIMARYQGASLFIALFNGVFTIVDHYVLSSLKDPGHISIIVFSLLIGGMVSVITVNGGMKGIVDKLSRYAASRRSGQMVTWILGIAIFFDDYANTLVVGNTMRPITDKLNISREKLAYLVDSTAAPVASIAFVTTWIGAELSYIQDGINVIGLQMSPYEVFFQSLSYAFYPIFTLAFIFILVMKKRDFGPMYLAEIVAAKGGVSGNSDASMSNQLNECVISENVKPRWYNAAIPVGVVIFGTLAGLWVTGSENVAWRDDYSWATNVSNVIGQADSYRALLWSSIGAVLTAVLLSLIQKLLSLKETMDSMVNGFRTMLTAIVILTLAWSIALVTKHMHTADFISQLITEVNLSPVWVPAITFVLAAMVAFSTGSSWGTMAILYPLVLPGAWLICTQTGLTGQETSAIFYNVVSTVLAGSVLGDHCSPISDTTILSSLASSCNHIEHVRTQLPYALTVGIVSVLVGTLPAAIGISSWILFPLGIFILYLIISFWGKKMPYGH